MNQVRDAPGRQPLTVRLDRVLLKQLKHLAVEKEMKLSRVIDEAIKEKLNREENK